MLVGDITFMIYLLHFLGLCVRLYDFRTSRSVIHIFLCFVSCRKVCVHLRDRLCHKNSTWGINFGLQCGRPCTWGHQPPVPPSNLASDIVFTAHRPTRLRRGNEAVQRKYISVSDSCLRSRKTPI